MYLFLYKGVNQQGLQNFNNRLAEESVLQNNKPTEVKQLLFATQQPFYPSNYGNVEKMSATKTRCCKITLIVFAVILAIMIIAIPLGLIPLYLADGK